MNLIKGKFTQILFISFIILLIIFFIIQIIYFIQKTKFVGIGVKPIITISGVGKVKISPNVAVFNFIIQGTDKSQVQAQKIVSEKGDRIISFLKKQGVKNENIKTINYNLFPEYNWVEGKREFIGYKVSQTIEVKLYNLNKVGKIIAGITDLGADSISNVTFKVDDKDFYKKQARQKAIKNAKEKARDLEEQLGIKFDKIIGFSEDNGSDMYSNTNSGPLFTAEAKDLSRPILPTGQNEVVSKVYITFEIH